MIKILYYSILLLLTYLTFVLINSYDTQIILSVFNYKITTSLAFVIIALLTITIFLMNIIRFFLFITNLPRKIIDFTKNGRLNNIKQNTQKALSYSLSGNFDEARSIALKLIKVNDPAVKQYADLILYRVSDSSDQQIYYLQDLSYNSPEFKHFASQELVRIYLENRDYQNALKIANELSYGNEKNLSNIEKLADIYANLKLWPKFFYIIEKWQRYFPDEFKNNADKISNFYYLAAKSSLESGEEKQTIKYLQHSLMLNPDNRDSIKLLADLYRTLDDSAEINKIIEKAWAVQPSLYLFEIYDESNKLSAKDKYQHLASLSDELKNLDLFILIAALLDLEPELKRLRSEKLKIRELKDWDNART